MKYISTKNMDLNDWVGMRKDYIGASDSGAILGYNPWKTNVEVFLEKTGQVKGPNDNLAMYLGRHMEPIIKNLFQSQEKLLIRADNKIRIDSEYDFLRTNLDGVVVGERVPVEYKTATTWDSDIPDHYFVQLQHQAMVTGSDYVYLAVLSLGRNKQFIVEKVKRSDEFIEHMRKELVLFWEEHVIKNNPPVPLTVKDARSLYNVDDSGAILEADDDLFSTYLILNGLKDKRNDLDRDINDLQVKIMNSMKDNTIIERDGFHIITWKKTKDINRFDRKTFSEEHPKLYRKYIKTTEGRRRFLLKEMESVFMNIEEQGVS